MDLLKTILLYMTMTFISSVQVAPDPALVMPSLEPTATAIVETAAPSATPEPTPTPTPVPTPAITPNKDYKNLRVGDKGDEVKTMQRRLTELGYYSGEIDGVFGSQTRRAVERFQYYQGLQADGIAGKATQTVLYESADVVFAPVDVTPTPTIRTTNGPTAAITEPPASQTPAPTFVPTPSPTAEPVASPDAESAATENEAPEESAEPEASPEASPEPMTDYTFLLPGSAEPLARTVQEQPETLHPLKQGETVYVPFLQVLEASGVVMIPGVDKEKEEIAFVLLEDVYRLSYVLDNAGNVTGLEIYRNEEPQVVSLRRGYVVEGVLYLPIEVTMELTGTSYTLDETALTYTVELPAPAAAE